MVVKHALSRAAGRVSPTRAALFALIGALVAAAAIAGNATGSPNRAQRAPASLASSAAAPTRYATHQPARGGLAASLASTPARSLKPTGGGWTNVAPLPQSVFGGAAASDGTNVYVFGGYHFPAAPGSTLNTVYRYNIATDTWTTLSTSAPMPQAALMPWAVYYPPTNKIYVFG